MKKIVFSILLMNIISLSVACSKATQYDYCMDYCSKGSECISGFNTSDCEDDCLRIKEDNPFSESLDEYGKILDPQLKLCSDQKYCETFIECQTAYENGEEWPAAVEDNTETENE